MRDHLPILFKARLHVAVVSALVGVASGCSGGGGSVASAVPGGTMPGTTAPGATAPSGTAPSGATPSPTPATGTTSSQSTYVASVRSSSPLVYYRMNEPSGTTAYDSSANKHNGTYSGGVILGESPLIVNDASAKSVSFPSGFANSNVAWTNPAVSAECWIKPTAADVASEPRIMSNAWSDHTGAGFMLWITAGTAAFNAGYLTARGTYPLTVGKTYHVVGTYDTTSGATLYIDGVSVANQNGTSSQAPQTGDGATTYVGVLNASSGGFGFTDYFQGNVSDCALYDHALTPTDVSAHYNAGAQANVMPAPLPTTTATPAAPAPTGAPSAITYNASNACINHHLFTNTVLPMNEGEFSTAGLDRAWWSRMRGNPLGGNQYSGFRVSWGRNQYDTYFGDASDGVSYASDDPFYVGADTAAPGSPKGVRISAVPMPAHLVGNPAVGGANWYSGVLDTPVNQQYGFFVARVRLPAPAPGMSPAFWLLTNNGVPQGAHGPLNGEWDIQEMFGNAVGDGMNAGNLQWNSGASTPQNWGGTFTWPPTGIAETSTPSQDYHDYGALISPGGATISTNQYGAGGPGYVYGPANQGVTNYLDGVPLYGHTGGADITSGVSWKELFAMFQVGAQGSFLGNPTPANFPAAYWVQWIRVYQPTTTAC